MKIVILAAGRGTRFNSKTPKCLTQLGDETVIERLIFQCKKYLPSAKIEIVTGFENQQVKSRLNDYSLIYNNRYFEDKNIYSGYLGLKNSDEDTLIFEGDCIFSEEAFQEIAASLKSRTLFFLRGPAELNKKNGIVKLGQDDQFIRFVIGNKSFEDIEDAYNMIGVLYIAQPDLARCRDIMSEIINENLNDYYFAPLTQNSKYFEMYGKVINSEYKTYTFNTKEKLNWILTDMGINQEIQLVEVDSLRHIEDFSQKRVDWLADKIQKEEVWTKPICVSKEGLVMDGQHRFEVAKKLKIKKIPAVIYDYYEVEVWSLRDNHEVTVDLVIERSLAENIYPYKTVKHKFPKETPSCRFPLKELINGS